MKTFIIISWMTRFGTLVPDKEKLRQMVSNRVEMYKIDGNMLKYT